jgi:hemerythrin
LRLPPGIDCGAIADRQAPNGCRFFAARQDDFCTACFPESELILVAFRWPFFYTEPRKKSDLPGSVMMEINLAGLLPEALLIDLPEIDAQHEEIFCRIEALKETCFGSGPVSLDEFDSLLNFLDYHFASEERIAREVGADFVAHAVVHRDNLQALRKAFVEVRDGARDVHSFLRYAEYWFERHITE